MTIQFTPGVKPNDPSKPRLYYRMFAKAGVIPPSTVDYTAFIPNDMLGNDNYGDCVYAADGHITVQQTFFGQGAAYVVSEQQALGAYSQMTGFDPSDPNTDQGDTLQNGLGYQMKYGFGGHKIAAFAQLDINNMNDIKNAVAEFGAVDLALNFPAFAMDQFNQGKPWDVSSTNTQIEGGHCVLLVGYSDAYLYVATWGGIQKVTYAFFKKYFVEAWALISEDWINAASGKDPEGVNKYDFGAQFAALTNLPNPFPTVTPPPPPPPPPANGPDAAELALIRAAARYGDSSRPKKYLTDALAAWEKDKGYS
jgi:hypothetical protein